MKAFMYEKYGPPETLRMAEVEKPAPDADEVLVKVLAVSVNPADWHSMRAKPLFSRLTPPAASAPLRSRSPSHTGPR
jgi:NADPH:quinone reductase-like Zn-dependent oxidoreductase